MGNRDEWGGVKESWGVYDDLVCGSLLANAQIVAKECVFSCQYGKLSLESGLESVFEKTTSRLAPIKHSCRSDV